MREVVFITGASRGIGAAAARLFGQAGYAVALGCRSRREEAEAVAEEIRAMGTDAMVVTGDVADRAQVNAMVAAVEQELGEISVLVNNAGIAQQKLFTDITQEDWDRMVGVNLSGVFYCCQAVLPSMIRRKRGRIINVSSIWGLQGASCEVHYSAAKAGVIGLTQGLAQEVGPSGITVNCVAPGVINTEMNAMLSPETLDCLKEETPLGILGQPEDIGRSILFLAGEGGRFITGQTISPNGGMIL